MNNFEDYKALEGFKFNETEEVSTPETAPAALDYESTVLAMANMPTAVPENDVLTGFSKLKEGYDQLAKSHGTLEARRKVATERNIRQLTNIQVLANDPNIDPELRSGAMALIDTRVREDTAVRAQRAAEEEALDRLETLAATDPIQAQVMAQNLERPGSEGANREFMVRSMLLERELGKLGVDKKEQSYFVDALDIFMDVVTSLVPGIRGEQIIDTVPGVNYGFFEKLWPAGVARKTAGALWNMPIDDFTKFVTSDLAKNIVNEARTFGYDSRTIAARTANIFVDGFSDGDYMLEGAFTVVAGATAPGIGTARHLAKGGTLGLLSAVGGRSQAEKLAHLAMIQHSSTGPAAAAKATSVSTDELTAAVQTTATNVTGTPPPGIPFPATIEARHSRAMALLEDIMPLDKAPNLTPEEKTKAIQLAVARAEKMTNRENTVNVGRKLVQLADGSKVERLVMQVGKSDGSLFASKQGATKSGHAMGLESFEEVQDASGKWAIQFEVDIPENGFRVVEADSGSGNIVKRILASATANTPDNLQGLATMARATRSQLYAQLNGNLQASLGVLNGTSLKSLNQVLKLGQHEAKWYDDAEFLFNYRRAHTPDKRTGDIPVAQEKEALQAYRTYIDTNDMEWAIRNDDMYRRLKDDGYETVTLSTPQGQILGQNVRIRDDFTKVGDSLVDGDGTGEFRVYNATDNIHYTEKRQTTPALFEKLQKQGYVLLDFPDAIKFVGVDGKEVYASKVLVKKSEISRRPVSRIQEGYAQGGHRPIAGSYFVKKAVRTTQGDTGRSVLLSPITLRSAATPAAGRAWASTMNEALEAASKGADEAAINEIFERAGSKGFSSAAEFLDDFKAGRYGDKSDPFEVVFDREMPSAYTTGGPDVAQFTDEVHHRNSKAGMAATHGRLYYSRKGDDVLRDVEGEFTTVIDPLAAMDAGLSNVARLSSLYEYRSRAVEQWVKAFGSSLERYNPNAGSVEVFMHGKVKDSVRGATRDKIEAQREAIKRVLRFRTREEQIYDDRMRQLAEWVMGDAKGGVRADVGNFVLDLKDKSIIGSIRAATFDLTLGMFNIAQLPLQVSTAIAAVSLSPRHGLGALSDYMALRHMRNVAARDPKRYKEFLNEITSSGVFKKNGFSSAAEYKEFLRYSADSGLFRLNDNISLIDNYGPSATYSAAGKAVQNVREWGRIPFYEAEYINQFTAYGIAWREARQAFPNMDFLSPAFKQEVARLTQNYGFRMMDEAQAGFQRGLLSLPTQFWAYPMRMVEAMAGRHFTPMQRFRLMMGQFILWGSAGLPLMSLITDKIAANNGEATQIGSPESLITRGLVDNVLYAAFDADVTVGRRLGVGSLPDQIIMSMMGENSFGIVTPIDLLGGASLSILGNTFAAITYTAKWQHALSGSEDGLDIQNNPGIEKLARQVTSVNNLMNAYYGFKYGKIVSRNGNPVTTVNDVEAGFAAFGIPPGSMLDIGALMGYSKKKKEGVSAAVKVLDQLDNEWKRDPSKLEENAKLAQLFMALQPKEWQDEIRRQHNRNARNNFETMHAGLADRVAKDIEQRELEQETE